MIRRSPDSYENCERSEATSPCTKVPAGQPSADTKIVSFQPISSRTPPRPREHAWLTGHDSDSSLDRGGATAVLVRVRAPSPDAAPPRRARGLERPLPHMRCDAIERATARGPCCVTLRPTHRADVAQLEAGRPASTPLTSAS
jgi:hypothetical protein